MKIFIRVTVQDEHEGEAYLSFRDDVACQVFGINYHSSDLFKEYFFQHGIFYYKSMAKKMSPEYAAIIEFFKMTRTEKYLNFKVVPFCKVGYDDQSPLIQTRDRITNIVQKQAIDGEAADGIDAAFAFASGAEHLRLMQKLIYVNGDIGEVTEHSGKLNLRQFTCLRCVKYVKTKPTKDEMKKTDDQSEFTDLPMRDETAGAATESWVGQDLGIDE